MREGQEEAVVVMIRQLARDIGSDVVPALSAEMLSAWRGRLHVMTAENSGLLVGACLWYPCFSTFRGLMGMHVSDLFVMAPMRGRQTGENLLRAAARDASAQGAKFIRLDVGSTALRSQKFYSALGFALDGHDKLMFLEPQDFSTFTAGSL